MVHSARHPRHDSYIRGEKCTFTQNLSTVFVQTNSIQAIKTYFKERLTPQFSENELKFMLKEAMWQRLSIPHNQYLLSDAHLLSESDLLYFRAIVKRLQHNEPFQYILGTTSFFGLELATDSRALIPRPETEELVEWVTQSLDPTAPLLIADICTGSGCIALALKHSLKQATVFAVDVSHEALALATENAERLNLPIDVRAFDVLTTSPEEEVLPRGFDCWVANPPYIPHKEAVEMQENVLNYEPHLALFVDDNDPLVFYRKIVYLASFHLAEGGKLFFEIHEQFSQEVSTMLSENDFINIEARKDLQGKTRMLKAEKVISSNE